MTARSINLLGSNSPSVTLAGACLGNRQKGPVGTTPLIDAQGMVLLSGTVGAEWRVPTVPGCLASLLEASIASGCRFVTTADGLRIEGDSGGVCFLERRGISAAEICLFSGGKGAQTPAALEAAQAPYWGALAMNWKVVKKNGAIGRYAYCALAPDVDGNAVLAAIAASGSGSRVKRALPALPALPVTGATSEVAWEVAPVAVVAGGNKHSKGKRTA